MNLHRLSPSLLLLGEHCYLDTTDECYFVSLYECSHKQGAKPAILRLKQNHRATITYFATQLSSCLPDEWSGTFTFVAIPSSSETHRAVRSIGAQLDVADFRDLIMQTGPTPSSQKGGRIPPSLRQELLAIRESATEPMPKALVVMDDVLTTGSHYRAVKQLLRCRWPGIRVVGIFLARVCSRRRRPCYYHSFKSRSLTSRDNNVSKDSSPCMQMCNCDPLDNSPGPDPSHPIYL